MQIVTNGIASNLPHHLDAGMAWAIMSGLECIKILENYLVSDG
jgi:hypothetical protein